MTSSVDRARLNVIDHIVDVQDRMSEIMHKLRYRAAYHDQSKLRDDEIGPLAEMQSLVEREGPAPFGTPEYERRRQMLGPMLDLHYARNSHHPEHYPGGVRDMCLVDMLEMLADWKAASKRGGPGSALNLDAAFERFGVPEDLARALRLTAERLGW